jgi:large subunit ribosomal protein L27
MAHVKGSGSVRQHPQSKRHGKRLGVKKSDGEAVIPGNIIVRQRGAKMKAGKGVQMGRDHTLFSVVNGIVHFKKRYGKTVVDVINS